jgi:hypothetical protein
MERALRYNGLLPAVNGDDGRIRMSQPTLEEVHQMKEYIEVNRKSITPLDIVIKGETPGNELEKWRSILSPWIDACMTWWMETRWSGPDLEKVRSRILQGPAHIE